MRSSGRRKLNTRRPALFVCLVLIMLALFCSCGEEEPSGPAQNTANTAQNAAPQNADPVPPENAASPAAPIVLEPEASGIYTEETAKAIIDYSHTQDGYVMVMFKEQTEKPLKAQIKCSRDTYTFTLAQGKWEVLPLGNGTDDYVVSVYENIEANKYAVVATVSFSALIKDEFAPFIRPNQYVNYLDAPNTLKKAAELTAGRTDALSQVEVVYNFVVGTMTYDDELARTVKSGYLPVLDDVLARMKGICFDYASLMTAMLRSRGIPCKLVVGYAGEAYHAWISVWSETEGWIDNAIFFDGKEWHRMDPTFASTGHKDKAVMQYIGDGSNYSEKYFY